MGIDGKLFVSNWWHFGDAVTRTIRIVIILELEFKNAVVIIFINRTRGDVAKITISAFKSFVS